MKYKVGDVLTPIRSIYGTTDKQLRATTKTPLVVVGQKQINEIPYVQVMRLFGSHTSVEVLQIPVYDTTPIEECPYPDIINAVEKYLGDLFEQNP